MDETAQQINMALMDGDIAELTDLIYSIGEDCDDDIVKREPHDIHFVSDMTIDGAYAFVSDFISMMDDRFWDCEDKSEREEIVGELYNKHYREDALDNAIFHVMYGLEEAMENFENAMKIIRKGGKNRRDTAVAINRILT